MRTPCWVIAGNYSETRPVTWTRVEAVVWLDYLLWVIFCRLFHWLFKTYWRRKREYSQLFAMPEHAHLQVLRFENPKQAQDWLKLL